MHDWTDRDVPILLLVREGAADWGAAGLRAGALAVLPWPCPADLLRAQIETALALKQRLDSWAQLAYADPLTGVGNRRAFDRQLETEMAAARRHAHPLSLAMIDIDQFKRVNDAYGHPMGDWVLIQVAQLIEGAVRQEDIVGRYGGEEFAVTMPFADVRGASLAARRILRAISRKTLQQGDRRVEVRLSVGTATFPTEVETAVELVEKADRRLYRAKSQGGGQFVGGL